MTDERHKPKPLPPDKEEALNRLYKDRSILSSKDRIENDSLSVEEKAAYLFEHGYIDKNIVSFESVVKKMKEYDERNKNDQTK